MGLLDFFRSAPDKASFAGIMLRWLSRHFPRRAFRVDLDEFRIVEQPPGSAVFLLDNVYRDYCKASRKERESVLATYGAVLGEADGLPATFAQARAHLMPVLRGRAMGEYLRLNAEEGDGGPETLAAAPFSQDTVLMLAYDTEHSTMMLTETQLRKWGVSFEEARAAALDNLRDATVARFQQVIGGVAISDWNDYYDPSRILLADVIHQAPVGAEPIVMLPNRNRLLVASSNDTQALMGMVDVARAVLTDEGRPVSAQMYRLEQGRAVAWQPADPQVRQALARLGQDMLAEDYAGQKELLDKYHEKHGIDVYVGSYQLIRSNASERIFSMAVWTEGVDSLLPKTDALVLMAQEDLERKDTPVRFIDWDELQRIAGPFQLVDNCYPPLYKPAAFPTAGQRAALADAFA